MYVLSKDKSQEEKCFPLPLPRPLHHLSVWKSPHLDPWQITSWRQCHVASALGCRHAGLLASLANGPFEEWMNEPISTTSPHLYSYKQATLCPSKSPSSLSIPPVALRQGLVFLEDGSVLPGVSHRLSALPCLAFKVH